MIAFPRFYTASPIAEVHRLTPLIPIERAMLRRARKRPTAPRLVDATRLLAKALRDANETIERFAAAFEALGDIEDGDI